MPSIRSFIWREPFPPQKAFERNAQSNLKRILKFSPIQWKRPSTNWWNCHGSKNGRGFCKYSMPKNRKRNKDRATKKLLVWKRCIDDVFYLVEYCHRENRKIQLKRKIHIPPNYQMYDWNFRNRDFILGHKGVQSWKCRFDKLSGGKLSGR